MSRMTIESRIGRLEKALDSGPELDSRISQLKAEELCLLVVAWLWGIKGLFDDLVESFDTPSEADKQELQTILSNPTTNGTGSFSYSSTPN